MNEIIILGAGPSASECNYDKEVWGVNTVIRFTRRRIDKLFFFDNLATFDPNVMSIEDLLNRNTEYISTPANAMYAAKLGIPVTVYPLEEVVNTFGTSYFSNSISYMIAYAMLKGVTRMDLYGVDHLTGRSYLSERAGVEYWLGRAEQLGIEVNVALGSAVLRTMDGKMYGYNDWYTGHNPRFNGQVMV